MVGSETGCEAEMYKDEERSTTRLQRGVRRASQKEFVGKIDISGLSVIIVNLIGARIQ
jgi:hypothetical protein